MTGNASPDANGSATSSSEFSPAGVNRLLRERWFDEGIRRIHCLPWEAATGLRWAQLLADLRARGRAMQVKDSLIAATALIHNLTVAALNRRHFEPAGVSIADPFA